MDVDTICLTRREKRCLILNYYKFREFRQLKNGNFNFRCTNKFCKASVIVNNNDQIIEQSKSSEHITTMHTLIKLYREKLLEVH